LRERAAPPRTGGADFPFAVFFAAPEERALVFDRAGLPAGFRVDLPRAGVPVVFFFAVVFGGFPRLPDFDADFLRVAMRPTPCERAFCTIPTRRIAVADQGAW